MAFYEAPVVQQSSSAEVPDTIYGIAHNHLFDTERPIIKIAGGDKLCMPLAEGTVVLDHSVATICTARYYPWEIMTSSTIHSIGDSSELSFITGITSGASVDVICYEYIDAHTLFLMYNWATSTTKRSVTYSRLLYASGDIFYMSNADSTFAASLNNDAASTAGSAYSGFLFKSDYAGAFNRMGIAYIRRHITAANVVTSTTLWHGYIAAHVTTSGSYRYLTKNVSSSFQAVSSTSTMYIVPSDGNFFFAHTNTSYRHLFARDSQVAAGTGGLINLYTTSGTGMIQTTGSSTSAKTTAYSVVGKLSDGNLLCVRHKDYGNRIMTSTKSFPMLHSHAITFLTSGYLYILDVSKTKATDLIEDTSAVISVFMISNSWYGGIYSFKGDIIGVTKGNGLRGENIGDGSYADASVASDGGYPTMTLYQIRKVFDSNDESYKYKLVELHTMTLQQNTSGRKASLSGMSSTYYLQNFPRFTGLYSDTFNKVSTTLYEPKVIEDDPISLSVTRGSMSATSVGNYALFGGGYASGYSSVVDAYDSSLTRSTPTELSVARYQLAATTVGNYALFGGGYARTYFSTVDAYDTSLTRSISTALSVARGSLAATAIGNYALFGGGYAITSSYSSVVDAYDTSLTRTTATELSVARHSLAATTVGNYAILVGGQNSAVLATVDIYDMSLTRSVGTALSVACSYCAATTISDYALIACGYTTKVVNTVNTYSKYLVRSTGTALATARCGCSAISNTNYALFGGGDTSGYESNYPDRTVDIYNASLTRSAIGYLESTGIRPGAAKVGRYLLFGGASATSQTTPYSKYVDAYYS